MKYTLVRLHIKMNALIDSRCWGVFIGTPVIRLYVIINVEHSIGIAIGNCLLKRVLASFFVIAAARGWQEIYRRAAYSGQVFLLWYCRRLAVAGQLVYYGIAALGIFKNERITDDLHWDL